MYLYHYYDKTIGPFKNLSDCSQEEANKIMEKIKAEKPGAFCIFFRKQVACQMARHNILNSLVPD